MNMMKLLLIVGLIGIVFTGGCLNQPNFPPELQAVDDIVISFMESVEEEIPPPAIIESYLETTTIGTGEDKDIFDFEDCDWDVQKYTTLGSYNTRSNKGWFINLDVYSIATNYYLSSPSYLYVGHGNHKLYDEVHGLQGYYTPSSLRISQYAGSGGVSGGQTWANMYTASGATRVNSPLFVMKENYVTAYMYYDRWMPSPFNSTCGGPMSSITIKVQLIDATSGGVISEQIFKRVWEATTSCYQITAGGTRYEGCSITNVPCYCTGGYTLTTDTLSNMEGMWRPVILNGSNYKGRTVFLRIDTTMSSGMQLSNTCYATGESFDVYFDEIHFSDEYGDYISYYTSVPPAPNYSYSISDRTVAVNGTSSTDNGNIIEYRWSWGDGTTSFDAIQTHIYSADNNYTCQLCVTDDEQMTVCIQKVLPVKTTPTTNTVVTGTTTPQNSTTTPPTTTTTTPTTTSTVTTTPTSSSAGGSTTTTVTNTVKAFPWWGFFVTIVGIFVALSALYWLFGRKGKKRLVLFKSKGGKRK